MIDDETHRTLLGRYIECRREAARMRFEATLQKRGSTGDLDARAAANEEEARGVEERLRQHWLGHGADLAILTRRLREIEYEQGVLALYRSRMALSPGTSEYEESVATQKSLTKEFRHFWVGSGHDLSELRRVLSSVDAEIVGLVAK